MRLIAVSLVLAAASASCKKSEDAAAAAKPPAAPPIKVVGAVAVAGPTPDVVTLTGTMAARERSDVTSDTQGRVIAELVHRGDHVKLGQGVFQLDVRTAALSAREAQATLASARAQKALAEQECVRTKSLLDKGAITQSEFDKQNTECTSAVQQVSAAEARTEMMTKSVADGLVRAPFDGTVSDTMVSSGEWVQPGKPMFTLVDTSVLRILLSVPEKAIGAVHLDQRVDVVTVAHPDKVYGATVFRISPEIGANRELIAEAKLDPGSDLVPGMFAEAHVTVGQTTRVIVPADAVVHRGRTWHAFVIKDGAAEDRIVQLGPPPAAGKISIAQGVANGEKVVTKLTDQIVDGTRVVE